MEANMVTKQHALVIAISLIAAIAPATASPSEPDLLIVSIPHIDAQPGERVVGFHLILSAGAVRRLDHIPVGWSISIDNDASWKTSITATVEVGAAALDPSFFQHFLTVQKNEFGDVKFALGGEVSLTKDFATERKITLTKESFEVQEVTQNR
jgi:hypothetical protein